MCAASGVEVEFFETDFCRGSPFSKYTATVASSCIVTYNSGGHQESASTSLYAPSTSSAAAALSDGAKAGIAIAVIAVVAIVAAGAYLAVTGKITFGAKKEGLLGSQPSFGGSINSGDVGNPTSTYRPPVVNERL